MNKPVTHWEGCETAHHECALAKLAAAREEAERYVWWLAHLATNQRTFEKVEIGDWAVECSHLVGTARRQIGHPYAVGKVVSIEPNSCYVLELLNGTTQRWENAMMRKLVSIDAARTGETQ